MSDLEKVNDSSFGSMINSNFDPMNLDLTEVKKLSAAMPRDGNIDLNQAEVLATKYLRGADLCSELLAIATANMSRADSKKKKTWNYAFLVKSAKQKDVKTDKMRSAIAEIDEDYVEACERHAEAQAFVKWVSSKYESFVRMHYMCRDILKRGYSHENAAGFNGRDDIGVGSGESEMDNW